MFRAACRSRVPLASGPLLGLVAALLASLCACATAPPISPQVMGEVNREISMPALAANPQAYVGQVALLGGRIIKTENLPQATEIEVLQLPLDGDGRPSEGDATQGRFLARLAGYADPAVFAPGRYITVAGRVKDPETRPVGRLLYRYPVLEALETHLWQARQNNGYPGFTFGIGVGTFF